MLHLILPAPLHRRLYRIADRLRHFWLRSFVSEVHGCSVIGRDREGRFLLVRHSYGPPVWTFPGGGLKRDERALDAALRELREELACTLVEIEYVGGQTDQFVGVTNHVRIVTGLVVGEPVPDRREVVEARFFHRHEFPAALSPAVNLRLAVLEGESQQG